MRCILGVDFDNTLVNYDDVFWKTAQRFGLASNGMIRQKKNIRDAIRHLPDGEKKWQELQAHVYGKAMDEAVLIDGVEEFLKMCRFLNVAVFIVSHKTKFAAQDTDKIDLRQGAMAWMKQKNFFDSDGLGFSVGEVFFESTRQEKIGRIKKLACTHFIDDLEETFLEESFPQGVNRMLYSPNAGHSLMNGVKIFESWMEIKEYINQETLGYKNECSGLHN